MSRALVLLALLVLPWIGLAACRSTDAPPSPQKILPGTGWRLVAMDDVAIDPRTAPTLAFPNEGGVNGDGGCNRYSATASLEGDELTLGPIATTRRTCEERVMARESRYLTLLGGTERVELLGGFLFLHVKDEETPLRFAPDPRYPSVVRASLRPPATPNAP